MNIHEVSRLAEQAKLETGDIESFLFEDRMIPTV